MSAVLNYVNQMISIMDVIKTNYSEYSKRLSSLDLLTQDVLHAIEALPFDAEQGHQFAVSLKEIRTRRRAVKNDLELLQIIVSNVQSVNFNTIKKKLEKKEKAQSDYEFKPKLMESNDSRSDIDAADEDMKLSEGKETQS